MKRCVLFIPLLVLAVVLVGCSSKSSSSSSNVSSSTPLLPNVSGSWEFILDSTANPGYSTGMEVAMQEGQDLVNGVYQENGQISASGSQIYFVGFPPDGNIAFGGNCAPAMDNTGNSLTGTVSGVGGSMNFSFTENGNAFNVTAVLDPSGQFIDSGTYTAQSGSTCIDSGTIASGKIVPKLTGTYAGKMVLPDGSSQSVTATLSENSSAVVTLDVTTGSMTFTLSGPATGNYFSATGTANVSGQVESVTYDGYYGLTYDSKDSNYDIVGVYLVNATNSANLTYAGTLTIPPTP